MNVEGVGLTGWLGPGAGNMEGEPEGHGLVQPGEEMVKGRSYCCSQLPDGRLQGRWRCMKAEQNTTDTS